MSGYGQPSADRMSEQTTNLALGVVVAGIVLYGVLWASGVLSALLSGHTVPSGHELAPVTAFGHGGDPSASWGSPVGPPVLYWGISVVLLGVLGVAGWWTWRTFSTVNGSRHGSRNLSTDDPSHLEGIASRHEVRMGAGAKALVAQASVLRPSLSKPAVTDVGWQVGTSWGIGCWMGVRDSMVLLGPPGSGKGFHLVIPAILDAPGAVLTTSTRPDNLAVSFAARRRGARPVAVFDPQGLAAGAPGGLRWSPIAGCERPQSAMIRAAALTAGVGKGVSEGSFWATQATTVVRCLLHAAALAGCTSRQIYEWSLHAAAARDAVSILASDPRAAQSWDRALDAIVSADPRQRDSVWSMVANSLGALADPGVLDALSPEPGEGFDVADFLARKGTLYLLGTSSGAAACAGIVSALIEDVIDVARRQAAASPGARLDPPLSLVLDEAANYPLPSLGALMSEGGGSGIPTMVVLQSLAQARDRWGRDTAEAIWDSATLKVVLGGVSNAGDLADISRLLGERRVVEHNQSYQLGSAGRSISTSTHQTPILDPAAIRTLRFGKALLLLRSAKPIVLELSPWTKRRDASDLVASRTSMERAARAGVLRAKGASDA